MRLAIIALSLAASATTASAEEAFVQHTDYEHGFVLAYPAAWRVVPGNIEFSKFKIATSDTDGMETCSVLVTPNVVPADAKPREIAAQLVASNAYEESLQPYAPGAIVVEKGTTTVSGLPAFYSIDQFTHVTLGATFEFMVIGVVTWVEGTAYRAQCATEVERFEEFHALFVAILSSVMVTNR
jgi:hypothetical protein